MRGFARSWSPVDLSGESRDSVGSMRAAFCLLLIHLIPACSTAAPEPNRPPPPRQTPSPPVAAVEAPSAEAEDLPAEAPATEVPTRCASNDGDVCTPDAAFADELCKKRQPNVALTLFQKDTPWTRTYVRVRDMEAWLVGGRRSSPAKLKLFEEVIIVHDRSAAEGGVKVSGSGSFDVVRWDGSCVSVMSDEVNTRRPSAPEVATIVWKKLSPGIRKALKKDQRIAYREEKKREHCKANRRSHRCKAAKHRLAQMVAAFIREGGSAPLPTELE